MKTTKYECRICSGFCDPGELVQGICPECMEKAGQDGDGGRMDPGAAPADGRMEAGESGGCVR